MNRSKWPTQEVSCLCTFSGAGPTELGFLQGLWADPELLQVGLWKLMPPPCTTGPSGAQHPTHEAPERTGNRTLSRVGFVPTRVLGTHMGWRIHRRKHRA